MVSLTAGLNQIVGIYSVKVHFLDVYKRQIPDRRCLDYGNLDLSGRLPDFRIKSRAAVGAAAAEGERG